MPEERPNIGARRESWTPHRMIGYKAREYIHVISCLTGACARYLEVGERLIYIVAERGGCSVGFSECNIISFNFSTGLLRVVL